MGSFQTMGNQVNNYGGFSQSPSYNQYGVQAPSSSPSSPYNFGTPYYGGVSYQPGTVPQQGSTYPASGGYPGALAGAGNATSMPAANGNGQIINPISPSLTQTYGEYLGSQIGTGLNPYDLSTNLPTGGYTSSGQLTANENPLLSQLQQYYGGGSGGYQGSGLGSYGLGSSGMSGGSQYNYGSMGGLSPLAGSNGYSNSMMPSQTGGGQAETTMQNMAYNGGAINTTPEWQAMVNAMQQPTQQGLAQLQEQFGAAGAGQSSPYGNAVANYLEQTGAQEQSLLGQMEVPALEQASSQQLSAANSLLNNQTSMAEYLQGLDQSSIQNQLSQYTQDLPQYNPLNNAIYGMSTTFPPYAGTNYGIGGTATALAGLGAATSLMNSTGGNSSPTATPSVYYGG